MSFIDPGQTALDNLDAAVTSAPEMASAPGLTADTALAGGDVPGATQAVAAGARGTMTAVAANSGGFGSLFGGIVHDASKILNAPMALAQHTYRYLHDVQARHGDAAAIFEGLGIAAGVAAGSILTGGLGDALVGAAGAAEGGAEIGEGIEGASDALDALKDAGVSKSGGALSKGVQFGSKFLNPVHGEEITGGLAAGYAEGHTSYQDSWQRTTNGDTYKDPRTGQQVSFGRDIAGGLLHLDHTSGAYSDVSGVLDGLFDIDSGNLPLLNVASAAHGVEGARGLAGTIGMLKGYGATADKVQAAFDRPGMYRNALDWFAKTSSASTILTAFPKMGAIIHDKQYLVGHDTDVSELVKGDFYHGTAYGDEGFDPERDYSRTNGGDNLRGPGFYASDKGQAAMSYPENKRDLDDFAPVAKRVYSLHWIAKDAPQLLDLRSAGSEDAEVLQDTMHRVLSDQQQVEDASAEGDFAANLTPENANFWQTVNDPGSKGSEVYDAWNTMMDSQFRGHDGMVPEGHSLYAALHEALAARGVDGFVDKGGTKIGGVGPHKAYTFFDPSKLGLVGTTEIKNAHFEKMMGLASASTAAEAHSVIMNRSVLGAEAIGHKLPTMSGTKLAMTALRGKTADLKVNNLHPFTGLLDPRTTMGNIRKLFSRTPIGMKGSLATLDPKFVQGLIQFWSAGVGQSAALAAADLLPDLDVAGRRQVVRNMFMNNLAAYAGVTTPVVAMTKLGEKLPDDLTMGSIQDPKIREKIAGMIDHSFPTRDPDYQGIYGSRLDGQAPRARVDADGNEHAAALMFSQATDDYAIPDLNEFHTMAKLFAHGHAHLGAIDQALFDNITSRFKSLALSTGAAYASHMALAEDVLNAQRLGLGTLIDGGLAASTGKSQWRALHADYDSIAKVKRLGSDAKQIGVVARSMRRAGRMMGVNLNAEQIAAIQRFSARSISRFITEEDARYAAEFAIATDGHMVPASLSATHQGGSGYSGLDTTASLDHTLHKMRYKLGDKYDQIERGKLDGRYDPEWQSQHRQAGKDRLHVAGAKAMLKAEQRGAKPAQVLTEGRKAILREMQDVPPEELSVMDSFTQKAKGSPKNMTPQQDWAADVAENIRGISYSPRTIRPNGKLLEKMANQQQVGLSELRAIPIEDRPLTIPGRVPVPSADHLLDRVIESDFHNVANPIIDSLARMPTATATYLKYRKAYAGMVATGKITDEMASIKAVADTEIDMVRFVHNPEDRVQMDMFMRNAAPFLFAQNQAYRRGLRLLADDPAAFMRYYRSIVGVAAVTQKLQDGEGNNYIGIPGAGYLTHPLVDALGLFGGSLSLNPTGFGGTLSSANVIFPMSQGPRPDLSPLVVVPAQFINGIMQMGANHYGSWTTPASKVQGAVQWVIGKESMSMPTLEQVVPNSIMYNALQTVSADDTSFNSVMMETMQNLNYEQQKAEAAWLAGGKKGPEPQIMPQDGASPAQIQEFLQKVKNQTRVAYIVKTLLGSLSPIGASVEVNDFGFSEELQADIAKAVKDGQGADAGYTAFLAKNPYATAYTTAKSSTVDNISLLESDAAQSWVVANMEKIKANPAYLYFMPQNTNTKYDSSVYAEQVADGLRTRDTPQSFLNALYTSAGDQVYYKAYDEHLAALQSIGSNSAALSAEYGRWDSYVTFLSTAYPTWYASFASGSKAEGAQATINQLQDIFDAGQEPPGEMATGIKGLLDNLDNANTAYVNAGYTTEYSTQQKTIKDNWQTYTAEVAKANPQLAPIIASVFRDALTSENPGSAP